MSDYLQSHGLQHTRLPYPSLSPGVCLNSCPLSQWCHVTISSSVAPFSSCPQSFPAAGYFSMSQLFTTGGQNIGASASAPFLPMNIRDWFPLGLTGLISLLSKELSRVLSKELILCCSAFFVSHSYMATGKTIALIYRPLSAKWCLWFLIHV